MQKLKEFEVLVNMLIVALPCLMVKKIKGRPEFLMRVIPLCDHYMFYHNHLPFSSSVFGASSRL